MAKGVNIPIAADASGVIKGTKDVEGALDKVIDSLDDVSDAGKDTDREVDRSLDRVEDSATDASEKLERKFKDAFDTVKKESKRAGDDVGDNVKKGSRKAEEATGEFKDEAKSNFSEVASSFTGDMDSAVDLVQGTLGGLASTDIPGVGLAAGAVAAGIGLVYSTLNAKAEEQRARITELTQAMIDANSKVIAEQFIQQNLADIASGADGAVISMSNLREAAEETGVPIEQLARAYAGDPGSVASALATVQAKLVDANEDAISLDNAVAASGVERQAELGRWAGALEGLQGNYDSAASGYQLYKDAVAAGEQANQGQVGETLKRYQDMHREIDNLPASKTVTLSVEADLTAAERSIRTWRPVITGTFRAGQAVI